MAAATAAMAFEAAGIDMPALVRHSRTGRQLRKGHAALEVRARKWAEWPSPWRGAGHRHLDELRTLAGLDKEPDVSTDAVARAPVRPRCGACR